METQQVTDEELEIAATILERAFLEIPEKEHAYRFFTIISKPLLRIALQSGMDVEQMKGYYIVSKMNSSYN